MKNKKLRNTLLAAVFVVCALSAAWFYDGINQDAETAARSRQPAILLNSGESGLSLANAFDQTNETADPALAHSASLDVFGPDGSAGQANQTDQFNQISQTNQSNQTGQANHKQTGLSSQTNQTNQTDPTGQVNQTSQFNQSNQTGLNLDKSNESDAGSPLVPAAPALPQPAAIANAQVAEAEFTGTLSVVCTTIQQNLKSLNRAKIEVLPEDGIIFPVQAVTFFEGETVFNVLQREMKKAGLHFEFAAVPLFNAKYIEGIGNIYEFDCGELSGWMYKVNGDFPNYGCSNYRLKDGDNIELVFTCNLGRDVGGDYLANRGGE